jgi:predicted secreted protein
MFDDARSKNLIFVAHCILNQNSISDGTAVFPGSINELLQLFMDMKIGIVQMPCPEFLCLGLDRGNTEGSKAPVVEENTRIRESMNKHAIQNKINQLVNNLIFQILEYRKHGFQILGIIGVNRSPSCGVETTSDNNREIKGSGLFIEALRRELQKQHISIEIMGIKASEIDIALSSVKSIIEPK